LQIDVFGAEEVRCMFLIVMELTHFTYNVKNISLSLMSYVNILVYRNRLIRWSNMFLHHFCFSLGCCESIFYGSLFLQFVSDIFT
jgi:hypothetical protein